MNKVEDVIIKDFHKGIAPSPHVGFQTIHNLDTYSKPGIIRNNRSTQKVSSTTITDNIKWIIKRGSSAVYALGESGKVYTSDTGASTWSVVAGNTTTSASGNGLGIWKDYLFVARDSLIDLYGPLSGSPAWTNGWQPEGANPWTAAGASDGDFHPILHGQDDILYFGAGRFISSLEETAGDTFDPSDAASYTFTAQALDLPSNYRVKCLAELGTFLMVGTIIGTETYGGTIKADIFPWDRTSDSFDLPISLPEFGVHQMITVNNTLYVVAGLRGNIYTTNGTAVRKIASLPYELMTPTDTDSFTALDFYPGAITYYEGRIYFGVSNNSNSLANGIEELGVWGLNPNGTLTFEHSISTGTSTSAALGNALFVGALLAIQTVGQLLIGWRDNATYGIDITEDEFYTSYSGYFISPLIQIATPTHKRTFQQVEFILAKPLATSQAIRIKYRKNLTDAFTTIGTYDFTTYGAVLSVNDAAKIVDAEFVQLRVELEGPSTTTPELREIRLR